MTAKEKLHQLVDSLSEEDATDLLEYAEWLVEEPETLSPEELAEAEANLEAMRRGEYVRARQAKTTGSPS